jgi:hypothetical protein
MFGKIFKKNPPVDLERTNYQDAIEFYEACEAHGYIKDIDGE